MSKLKAIGVISHRTHPEVYPSFEVSTCRNEYQYGSSFFLGVRADTGGTYSVMAASWKFDKYANLSNKDDDGMNKESEIIDELIEDERHDCDNPKVEEWQPGERPPLDVWLEFYPGEFAPMYCVAKYIFTGDELGIFVRKDGKHEETARWSGFKYRRWIDPKEKALAQIAFALATKVIGEDAAKEINFNRDNEFSSDYRNMAKAIIDGCIGHVEYTGGK
ncbi:TPA: hypothetical protein K8193_004316 [Escherichia coli]|nr:hypothetical protein [Escherichia coli]HBH7156255.1 hypothetical protein [Escherichia coli]HBH7222256.1 hypothetical protein [Escherichia coli]HBH7711485.1 hypothetical protein [Escherichia coli]HBH7786348.1 hypothetical protein [Escherichia coli]